MKPCPICEFVPYQDVQPESNGYDTFCGNCNTKLWDVETRPVVVDKEWAAKQRDIWTAISMLCLPVAHHGVAIREIYEEAQDKAEEMDTYAEGAECTDPKVNELVNEIRKMVNDGNN